MFVRTERKDASGIEDADGHYMDYLGLHIVSRFFGPADDCPEVDCESSLFVLRQIYACLGEATKILDLFRDFFVDRKCRFHGGAGEGQGIRGEGGRENQRDLCANQDE